LDVSCGCRALVDKLWAAVCQRDHVLVVTAAEEIVVAAVLERFQFRGEHERRGRGADPVADGQPDHCWIADWY
jgi:hypothetical protein